LSWMPASALGPCRGAIETSSELSRRRPASEEAGLRGSARAGGCVEPRSGRYELRPLRADTTNASFGLSAVARS
jgi:hypothetical protein